MYDFVLFSHFTRTLRNSTSHTFTIHRHFASELKIYEYQAARSWDNDEIPNSWCSLNFFFFFYFSCLRRILTSIEVTIAFAASALNVVAKNNKHFILRIYLFIVQFQLSCMYVYHCRMLWRCVNMNAMNTIPVVFTCLLAGMTLPHTITISMNSFNSHFFFQYSAEIVEFFLLGENPMHQGEIVGVRCERSKFCWEIRINFICL